jgi:hypothetical protein
MSETTLDDVRRRILASLEEMQAAGPVRRWHGHPFEWVRRNHRVALGVVDLLGGIARDLGEARVRAFAKEDTAGRIRLVLRPTNPEAAELTVIVEPFDDIVQLYPWDRGRIEMFPGRRELPESFLSKIATYVNAVVTGGFRVTYSNRTRPGDAKLEFLIDGSWRRAGGVMIRGVSSSNAVTRRFDAY